jgi:hypothetical protein
LKSKRKKSAEALDRSLMAEGLFSDWFDWLEKVENPQQYLEFLPAESAGRKLANFWLNLDSQKVEGTEEENQDQGMPDPAHTMSRWYFLGRLHAGLNSSADELILRAQHQLDLTEMILQFKGMLRASKPTAQWKEAIDVGKFAVLLVGARRSITSNLGELQSLKRTSESISKKYAPGHNMLLKCFAQRATRLEERTQECSEEYQHQLRELKSIRGRSAAEWPSELCEIDFKAIEEFSESESKATLRRLTDVARAEMLIAFDQTPEAFEVLKPHLKGDCDQEKNNY